MTQYSVQSMQDQKNFLTILSLNFCDFNSFGSLMGQSFPTLLRIFFFFFGWLGLFQPYWGIFLLAINTRMYLKSHIDQHKMNHLCSKPQYKHCEQALKHKQDCLFSKLPTSLFKFKQINLVFIRIEGSLQKDSCQARLQTSSSWSYDTMQAYSALSSFRLDPGISLDITQSKLKPQNTIPVLAEYCQIL